jgi:hypothetical protein
MSKPELNEDVEHVIKSFLPSLTRFRSLRKVYTNEFLAEGLKKKTVAQLTLIQRNLIKMVNSGELEQIRPFFLSYGLDIAELKTRKNICWSTLDRWKSLNGKKEEKIKKIVDFVQRLSDIVFRKSIDGFSIEIIIKNTRTIHNLIFVRQKLVKLVQHTFAAKVLKVLVLLVSILKNPEKKRVQKTTAGFTEVD